MKGPLIFEKVSKNHDSVNKALINRYEQVSISSGMGRTEGPKFEMPLNGKLIFLLVIKISYYQ